MIKPTTPVPQYSGALARRHPVPIVQRKVGTRRCDKAEVSCLDLSTICASSTLLTR
jgi:hypothetical protein